MQQQQGLPPVGKWWQRLQCSRDTLCMLLLGALAGSASGVMSGMTGRRSSSSGNSDSSTTPYAYNPVSSTALPSQDACSICS
jgi:hypothetical protein